MGVLDEALAVAQLIKDGDISAELLQGLEDAAILQEASQNQYDMVELTAGRREDRGKFKLVPKKLHGGTNLGSTIDGLLMDAQVQRTGEPIVIPMGETDRSQRVRMAAERMLAPAGASQLAKVGLRAGGVEQLDAAERMLRAQDRLVELDRNFDPVSGARLDEVGLDGGHIKDHHNNPELSTARDNMRFENKYVNRVKGARSGEDAVNAYKNSILKRLKSGALSPLELVNSYQYNDVAGDQQMSDQATSGNGDIVVNSQGGDVKIGDEAIRNNSKRTRRFARA